MKRSIVVLAFVLVAQAVMAAEIPKMFYIYKDKGSLMNHYCPSGFMGNYGSLKMDEGDRSNPKEGTTDIKITNDGSNKEGAGWAGIYWLHPCNNWGSRDGGYDLSSYSKLTFWARSDDKDVTIDTFKIGGITGEFNDTGDASIGPIMLTKEWKQYEISLKNSDLHKIIGGFCFSTADGSTPEKGYTMYLDDIKFEK